MSRILAKIEEIRQKATSWESGGDIDSDGHAKLMAELADLEEIVRYDSMNLGARLAAERAKAEGLSGSTSSDGLFTWSIPQGKAWPMGHNQLRETGV